MAMPKKDASLMEIVFSWSISDVCNQNLYKGQVKEIPKTFSSTQEYMNSFKVPLIEETRADLYSKFCELSKAPLFKTLSIEPGKGFKPPTVFKYRVESSGMRETVKEGAFYKPEVGDLVALTQVKPRCADDLNGPKLPFTMAIVEGVSDEDEDGDGDGDKKDPIITTIQSSKMIDLEWFKEDSPGSWKEKNDRNRLFVVHLTNMVTNNRIWCSLNNSTKECNGTMNIIKNVLHFDPSSDHCDSCCSVEENQTEPLLSARLHTTSFDLDDSQKAAVLECIARKECTHRNSLKLIWGPPGTGKTKTVASLLYVLLMMKSRTITCAPTNIAVLGVASRLMDLYRRRLQLDTYGCGDIVVFGNEERMKMDDHEELHNVFLDYRVWILYCCCLPQTGWTGSAKSFIALLEDPQEAYRQYKKEEETGSLSSNIFDEPKTFAEFFMSAFYSLRNSLIFCTKNLYTHYPTMLIPSTTAQMMVRLVHLLKSNRRTKTMKTSEEMQDSEMESVEILKSLQNMLNLPKKISKFELKNLCLKNAVLIFCTASGSSKLSGGMSPFELLVVDEAAQLKECESTIPLQLPGLRHAILIGDQKQLPAMVQSRICDKAMFGRSLFERMVILGMPRHLLNIQYRMHPSISLFPNNQFYQGKILNGPNVIKREYQKQFLKGPMFGSYSFIDVGFGMESDGDEGFSKMNMVEVVAVSEIVKRVYEASVAAKRKVSIGCISPYKAQVNALQKRLGKNYSNIEDFSVNVRSVDGFQGGEEDVIIISTVRCNGNGSIGFLSNLQRANVALTRARYGLWILGNGATLINSDSIWKDLVTDAKRRGCYFNASDDDNLSQAIYGSLIELGQLHLLFNSDSKEASWMVRFSDEFYHSMKKSIECGIYKDVISLMKRLSMGWREHEIVTSESGTSIDHLEMYKISKDLSLVWSVDLVLQRSQSMDTQVIKIWDILHPSKIPQLVDKLKIIVGKYTVPKMNRCKSKIYDGDLAIPATWPADSTTMAGGSRKMANSNWRGNGESSSFKL